MAAPRSDVKYYLDGIDHASLKVFAGHDGVGIGELTEQVMAAYLAKRRHDAIVLAEELAKAGITRDTVDPAGKGRE
ncbi:MAG TPA: hypothetical protein VGK73_07725 [Polyangiaceae bacterium]